MTFFVEVWRSATSFKFYKEIAFQRLAKSLGYFFLFILVVTVILSVKLGPVLIQGVDELSEKIIDKLPQIKIENGVVSTDAQEPFTIEEQEFIFIIDTTGEITQIDPSYKQGILLTKNKLIHKQGEINTREYDLSKIKSFTLDYETIRKWKELFRRFSLPILFVSLFPYFIIVKLIQILLFSLLALVVNAATKTNLKYENLFNISLFALTPPVLLSTVFTLVGLQIPLLELLYIVIYIIFLIEGVKSCRGFMTPVNSSAI